ncbi:MAG: acetyltransferase, partial [Alphaproteobacteria bacterium]|nr:acetyltransferase [Alphaproteobacteria bacterium]
MAKRELIIFGAGQTAEVAHFYFTNDSAYDVVAFTVNAEYITADTLFGLPVVPFEDVAEKFPPAGHDMFVAVTYSGLNKIRAQKLNETKAKGYTCPSYVSSKATVWPGLNHGENCLILEDNTIQPHVTIGDDVYLWSGNHIGHHSVLRDHVYIASHVVVSGAVEIGEYSFIGVNATLRDNIRIGR